MSCEARAVPATHAEAIRVARRIGAARRRSDRIDRVIGVRPP
jgi:hypothetical protein